MSEHHLTITNTLGGSSDAPPARSDSEDGAAAKPLLLDLKTGHIPTHP